MSSGRENKSSEITKRYQGSLDILPAKKFLHRIAGLSNEQKYRLLVFSIPLLLFFVSFFIRAYSTSSLYTWDEGWVSIIARKMLEDSNWFVPVYFGEGNIYYLFDKPFFVFWFFAGSMLVFGFTSLASKLPLIVAGSALSPLAYFLTKGKGNELNDIARGLIAGLFVSVGYFLVLYSRTAYIDPLVVFFSSLAAFCAIKSVDQFFDEHYRSTLFWLLMTAVTTSITILCKAWQGLVFLPAVGIYFVLKLWKYLNSEQEFQSGSEITQKTILTFSLVKYSLPGCLATFLVYALLNLQLFLIALIPVIFTLFHSSRNFGRLQHLYSSNRNKMVVIVADFLGKTLASIIPAIILKISLYGLTDAIREVFVLLGFVWGLLIFQVFIAVLSSLLLWLALNWIYEPLEELIVKEEVFLKLSAVRISSKFMLTLTPGLLLLGWGLVLFWIKPQISPLSMTLLFTGCTFTFLAAYTFVHLIIGVKRTTGWTFAGKLVFFELSTILLIFLAFIPLLAWIDWIDSKDLGYVIRKSGEMAMHPEMPVPDPLTYRWLFFEYYLGWRYSYGTVYTVVDSLGVFLDPLFLAGVPFFFAGLYYLWTQDQSERGFFFLTWFASILFVFLPAQFQLNYYYYPVFLPFFNLAAIGVYETAMNNKSLRFPSARSRIAMFLTIMLIQAIFLYRPLLLLTGPDLGYLITVIVVITGGAFAVTLIGRNLLEIVAGWICVIAIHRFLIWSNPSVVLAVMVVGGGTAVSLLSLVRTKLGGFPVRSLIIIVIVVFTGMMGAANTISREGENDLYPDRIASYIEKHGGTGNNTCWAPNVAGFACVLRYELGNPFISYFENLQPFSDNTTLAVERYISSHMGIKFWIVFFEKVDEIEDVRQYSAAWNYFVNLPEIKDVSKEAGLPERSITRLFANQTAL
ncbi:MAG: ArnT family glycosyltransferase [Candidatus Odinarchaeota archaeon]